MARIDPTARVHQAAVIADDVVIGPYSIIGEHVRIGPATVIESHCVIAGRTEIGRSNHIHHHVSLGTPPQDHSYRGEPTRLLIGDENHIREFVTINTGTIKGGGITIVGNQNMLMACSHVAHDCLVGDRTVIANCALLAGHVKVEDGCVLSGLVAVHHFVTLGTISMIGGLTGAAHDVPPYMMMLTDHRTPRGVNVVGMKRNGYSDSEIKSVRRAFRLLYRGKITRHEAIRELENSGHMTRPVTRLVAFLKRVELGQAGRFLETTRQPQGGAS